MSPSPATVAGIGKLHGAYELVRQALEDFDNRWDRILGPVMDLLANVGDLAEEADEANAS